MFWCFDPIIIKIVININIIIIIIIIRLIVVFIIIIHVWYFTNRQCTNISVHLLLLFAGSDGGLALSTPFLGLSQKQRKRTRRANLEEQRSVKQASGIKKKMRWDHDDEQQQQAHEINH